MAHFAPESVDQFRSESPAQFHRNPQAFLCGSGNIDIGPALSGINAAIFSGEGGLILQKIKGEGIAFIHAGGSMIRQTIPVGETLRIETGSLVAWDSQLSFDITFVRGIKNIFFSGEGLWFTTLENKTTKPQHAYIQSLPFKRLIQIFHDKLPKPKKS